MLDLCQRFGKLPEEIYAADASLLRLLELEALGRSEP